MEAQENAYTVSLGYNLIYYPCYGYNGCIAWRAREKVGATLIHKSKNKALRARQDLFGVGAVWYRELASYQSPIDIAFPGEKECFSGRWSKHKYPLGKPSFFFLQSALFRPGCTNISLVNACRCPQNEKQDGTLPHCMAGQGQPHIPILYI